MTDQRAHERPLIRLAEPGELLPGEPFRIVTRPELTVVVQNNADATFAELVGVINQVHWRRQHTVEPPGSAAPVQPTFCPERPMP